MWSSIHSLCQAMSGGVYSVIPTYLSRMNRILSFANKPRLDRHEKPNRARVKKNIPIQMRNIRSRDKLETGRPDGLTKAVLETCNVISDIVKKEAADHYPQKSIYAQSKDTALTSQRNTPQVMSRQQRRVPIQVLECPPTQDPELSRPARTAPSSQHSSFPNNVPHLHHADSFSAVVYRAVGWCRSFPRDKAVTR